MGERLGRYGYPSERTNSSLDDERPVGIVRFRSGLASDFGSRVPDRLQEVLGPLTDRVPFRDHVVQFVARGLVVEPDQIS